jgi:predicted AlkP superfamily phosphohydrolase/phosphomutase
MIAILQFDSVSLPHLNQLLNEGRLPTLAKLRARGEWLRLETPALQWEGATFFSLYSGKGVKDHGIYFPFVWSAADQRVRPQDDYQMPEAVWERLAKSGKRSLVIDPYEGKPPEEMAGKALCGWQFKHKVVLRRWSVPHGLNRELDRRFGGPSLVEEIFGKPSIPYLARMRERLLTSPRRAADVASALLSEEQFDLVWITLSASHIAGHWFLDPSRLPIERSDGRTKEKLNATLTDAYAAVDEAVSRILACFPMNTDLMVLSPSSIGPSASRTHLLPGMLQAVLAGPRTRSSEPRKGGNFLWWLRAAIPSDLRGGVARMLPDEWAMQLTARLEMRGMDWSHTRAFMVPSGDCGYIRLNLSGREREGIVDPKEANQVLEQIASGLLTFRDPDGQPAVKHVEITSPTDDERTRSNPLPDMVVHWSDQLPPHVAGAYSPQFGEVPSAGWGSGRTGEHRDEAWALLIPGSSKKLTPVKPPHIMDIVPTICSVLGVDREGLAGQPLLERL